MRRWKAWGALTALTALGVGMSWFATRYREHTAPSLILEVAFMTAGVVQLVFSGVMRVLDDNDDQLSML